jgi:hypothetical protein
MDPQQERNARDFDPAAFLFFGLPVYLAAL